MTLLSIFKRSQCASNADYEDTVLDTRLQDMRLESYLVERYENITCLSETPSASVWKVTLPGADAVQILKVFPPGKQSAFRREASVALGLRHDNIVSCMDTFVLPDGHACLTYEFAQDGNLALFAAKVRLHGTAVRHAISDILRGLVHLHAQGYVHCDIKPANVLVASGDGDGGRCFKLADLGSAATLKEAQSGRHGIGSPAYTAPERLYNQFGFSSDVYSVGIVAFELLTGHLPFMGEVDEVYRAHLTRAMPLNEVNDPFWQEWLEQATHKIPRSRFQTAEAAWLALDSGFAVTPIAPVKRGVDDRVVALPAHQPSTRHPAPIHRPSQSTQGNEPVHIHIGAPGHPRLIASAGTDYAFLAADAGLTTLQFSTGAMVSLTASKGPYAGYLDGVAYSSGNRIGHASPVTRIKTTIIDMVDHPVAVAVSADMVAFVEQRRVVVQRRSDASVCLALRHRHYAMDPLIALGAESFALTAGLANNELWLRSFEGDVILKMSADGPWVGLCTGAGLYVAVCSSLVNPERLKIYTIYEDGRQQCREVYCASLEVATCATGAAYVEADSSIHFVSSGTLSTHIFSPRLKDIQSLALQADATCCFVSHIAQRQQQVTRFMRTASNQLEGVL